jgi:hypothetical protein
VVRGRLLLLSYVHVRYLEHRAKAKTSDALVKLMGYKVRIPRSCPVLALGLLQLLLSIG